MSTTKYSCIIIDDEPQAVEFLAGQIKMLNKDIDVRKTFTSWSKAIEGLKTVECDILFLDISIHGKNGLDLLKIFPEIKSEIVFITAYSDFAVGAIKFSPCGYILKPVDDVELSQTIDKAIARVNAKRAAMQPTEGQPVEKVGIFNNKGIDYVDVTDILYFESINQYTRIVAQKSEFTSSYHLAKFASVTCRYPFYKVHRSYVVNLKHVLRYETSGIVIMSNKKEIPVSRSQRSDFIRMFGTVH